MKLFKFRNEIYEDYKRAVNEIQTLERKKADVEEDLSQERTLTRHYRDDLENLYNTLKTICSITKDSTIKSICYLKMEDIANIDGIYISRD